MIRETFKKGLTAVQLLHSEPQVHFLFLLTCVTSVTSVTFVTFPLSWQLWCVLFW